MNNESTTSDQYEIVNGLIHITRLLSKNIRRITVLVLGAMLLAAIIVILIPNKYRSDASILPTGTQDNLSALKMLAGFSGTGLDMDENSSALYPNILESNQLRDAIIAHKYITGDEPDQETVTLKEYFDDDKPERLREALGDLTRVEVDAETGIIFISVTTPDPSFSQQILTQTLAELENYNLNIRKSQAKESELYLERELKNQEQILAESEDSLLSFQKTNMDWYATSDPEILMTLGRLKQDIEINAQTYALLREQYEMARLTAQKDVPIVRVLDSPSLPTMKCSPLRVVTVILTGMIAFVLSFGFFVISDSYKRASEQFSQKFLKSISDDLARAFPAVNRLLIKRKERSSKNHETSERTNN
jgi:uncharacterized protein involved in exopolysaccharide biosynthesis